MQIIQSDIIDPKAASFAKKFKGGVCCPAFDSLAEAIVWGETAKVNSTFASHPFSKDDNNESFSGSPNWPAMKKIVRDGWVKGREKIAANLAAIFASGAAELTCGAAVEHAVGGAYPDVPLYVAGNVCHMVSEGDQLDSKPIIKLLINVSASASTSRERIANRGAAVAALVDEIESAGNSCEVHAVDGATQSGASGRSFFCPVIQLKKSSEAISIDDLAFGLGHPSMLRRVCFAIIETIPFTNTRGFSNGYGSTGDVPSDALPYDAIYLAGVDCGGSEYNTPEAAMEEVRKLYQKQAIERGLVEVTQ